jgi:hypothetical protein
MSRISQTTFDELDIFKDNLNQKIGQARNFEEAAQIYTSELYQWFKESLVLARVFATVPYEHLPTFNKNFVDKLATSKQVHHLLQPQTLVLSLLGTSGDEPAWNDRRLSQGHVGIPMVSAAFIETIPMMSRLLKQLGIGLDWIASNDSQIVTRAAGRMSGVFFVADAATEEDRQARKIIAAQDFVAAHNIRTVLGFGGEYLGTETFVVTILFLREPLEKNRVELFAAACSMKVSTINLARQSSLFS